MTDIRTHYLDTSVIVKLLVDEDGSTAVRAYLGGHAVNFTTSLCFAETLGVLKAKHVHNRISQEQYLAASEEIMARLRDQTLNIEDIALTERAVFEEVESLAQKHTLDLADAYQLLTIRTSFLSNLSGDSRPILVTADRRLAVAARSEGLRAWDCMHEPPP